MPWQDLDPGLAGGMPFGKADSLGYPRSGMRGHDQAGDHAPEELTVLPVGDRSQDRRHLREPDSLGGTERGRAVRISDRVAEAPGGGAAGASAVDALVLSGANGNQLTPP